MNGMPQFYIKRELSALGYLGDLWFCDPEIILHHHKDGTIQTTGIENDFVVLLDERVRQNLQLVVERKRWDRPDHAARQLLRLLACSERDAVRLIMPLDPIEVDAAAARHVGKTVKAFLSIQPHLYNDRLDRLLDTVSADLRDDLRMSLGRVFDHAVDCMLAVQ